MVEQSPIASFMICFMCSPSSPAVLPIAALLILSLPVFAGKKYRPKSCFGVKPAKAGLSHRRNIQKHRHLLGVFNKQKTEAGFSVPHLLIEMFALWAGSAARESNRKSRQRLDRHGTIVVGSCETSHHYKCSGCEVNDEQ